MLLPLRTETLAERLVAEDMLEQIAVTLSKSHVAWIRLASAHAASGLERNLRIRNARYCLTGRLRLAGDVARVTAICMIDVSTDRHVWGDSFDGSAIELLALENRVIDDVLCGVVAGITQCEVEDAKAKPTECLTARES